MLKSKGVAARYASRPFSSAKPADIGRYMQKMARAVGNALHRNPDPASIPCHRVVNSKGELAGEYAFGGMWKQAEILREEGVVSENGKVDLKKYGYH